MKQSIMKHKEKYVERMLVEYDAGQTISVVVHLTDEKSEAYRFDENEIESINGLTMLDMVVADND